MKRRDEEAFEAFVTSSGHSLLRAAYLLTGDLGHAEDLVQVTLERTARRWHRLEGAPQAYARTVLTNLANDRWRRRRARVAETPLDDGFEAVDHSDAPDQALLRQTLVGALRQLPIRQRTVLVLRFFEDMTEAETAHTMRVSVGTVKSTTNRAVARLRELCPDLEDFRTASKGSGS